MPWFKVDDGLWGHPKWLALAGKPRARSLWVTAGSWCSANLTDGHVPTHVLVALGARPADATALVTVGLWIRSDGGWRFHDWEEFQPSSSRVKAARKATAERVAKWREVQRKASGNGVSNGVTEEGCNGVSNAPPGPSRPVPSQTPLLTLAGRLTEVGARDLAAGLPQQVVDEWQDIAGPGIDLETEARAYLARHGDTTPNDPRSAWLGWLKAARRHHDQTHPPDPPRGCGGADCHGGWLPDAPDGRAVPCPTCRPHLRPLPHPDTQEAS